MTLKKTDLARQLKLKIEGQMKGPAVAGRYGQGATAMADRKEQRKLDAAAGLVPFACKLPAALTEQLRERGASHEGGLNGLVAELLGAALQDKS